MFSIFTDIKILDMNDDSRRALFLALNIIGAIIVLSFLPFNLFILGSPYLAFSNLMIGLFFIFNIFVFPKFFPINISIQFIFLAGFIHLVNLSLVLGGTNDPGLCWYIFFVELAIPLLTTSSTIIWAIICLLVYPALYFIYQTPLSLFQLSLSEEKWTQTYYANYYIFILASGLVFFYFNKAVRHSYEEIKRSKEYLTELVRIIGHDINNPLTIIRGLTEVVKEDSDNTDETNKKLLLIHKETEKIKKMIEKVREWKALESGKEEIQIKPITLAQALQRAIESEKEKIINKRIAVVVKTIPQEIKVLADGDILSFKIIKEVLNNAIKYSFPKSTITISAQIDRENLLLKIKDEGIGIPQKEIPKITRFDRQFIRVGTGSEKGSGLALPLALIYLKKMKGDLKIQAKEFSQLEEHGCEFTIILKIAGKK